MTQTTNSTTSQAINNIFAPVEAKNVVAPKNATYDSSTFETTPPKKDEAEAVVASEVTQVEGSEAAQDAQAETTPEVSEESAPIKKKSGLAKRMSLEMMREYAEPIATASKNHKDGVYTINLSTVSDAAKCDKTIAAQIIHLAMSITKTYIEIVDDKPSTTITHPHVNSQHSLLIPSKTMQSIKGDDDKMLFPVGTKFTMTYDAEKIVLTKLA